MTVGRNLSTAWQNATAEDIEIGSQLYREYRQRILVIAIDYGKPLSAACGAFAALSPVTKIEGNFRSLVTCMEAVRHGLSASDISVTTYNRGKEAALRILRGSVDFSDVCSGPKITAFRHNLLFPDTSDRVTIDGHMIGIMSGRPLTMREALLSDKAQRGGGDRTRYEAAERAFLRWWRRHPEARKVPPCAAQAILWHAKRRQERGEFPLGHGLPDRFEPYPLRE